MASIPKPATLSINAGDKINYQGVLVTIASVAAGSDNNAGVISYALTLSLAGSPVLTVSANDTVLSYPGTEAASTGVQTWTHGGPQSNLI